MKYAFFHLANEYIEHPSLYDAPDSILDDVTIDVRLPNQSEFANPYKLHICEIKCETIDAGIQIFYDWLGIGVQEIIHWKSMVDRQLDDDFILTVVKQLNLIAVDYANFD